MDEKELKKLWLYEQTFKGTYILKKYKGNEISVIIPDTINDKPVTGIASFCFFDDNNIEYLEMGANIEEIGSCQNLKKAKKIIFKKIPTRVEGSFNVSKDVETFGMVGDELIVDNVLYGVTKNIKGNYYLDEGIIEIDSSVFENNDRIEKIKLPNSLKKIGTSTFKDCINLRDINLENIIEMSLSSFENTKIEKVIINNIPFIGGQAFKNCEKLKEVVINDGVKIIGAEAFKNCMNLEKIILPSTLEEIGEEAFANCDNIKEINIPDGAKIGKNSIDKKFIRKSSKVKKETEQIIIEDNKEKKSLLNKLLKDTKKMNKDEIEKYVNKLLKEHKLDNFDTSDITDMNVITFNKDNGEITWKCHKCGYCTSYLWDLLADKGKMIDKFDISGCGYCK